MFRVWSISGGLMMVALVVILMAVLFSSPLRDALWRRATGRSAAIPAAGPVYTAAPTVEQVQQLAELVALRVRVVDIRTVEQPGWLTGYKGVWLVKGDALWTTDLEEARIDEIQSRSGQRLVQIELPRPEVRWARLDHTQTRTYDLQSKAWLPLFRIPEEVRDEALRQGQELVERAARHDDYRQQAERRTESVLAMFYASFGVPAEIVWRNPASATCPPTSSP